MKKITSIGIIALIGALASALPAFAATDITLSRTDIKASAGTTFALTISVAPQATTDYAEKVELDYPANLLEARSFGFANNWMALSQTGYDVTDNVNGVLVKTAGYPGGITSATQFGTVVFYAKKAGSGTITIGGNSVSFQVSGETPSSGAGAALTIAASTAAAPATNASAVQPAAAPSVSSASSSVQSSVQDDTLAPPSGTPQPDNGLQSAAAANASSGLSGGAWAAIVILAVIVIGVIWLTVRKRRKGLDNIN